MNFLIVLACVSLAAADVSHLSSTYLPPQRSSSVINYNTPVVSTYSQEVRPEITYSRQVNVAPTYSRQVNVVPTYSRQVNVAPSVEIIGGGYDSGLSGLSGSGLIGSGYSGSGLIGSGYSGSGLIGGGLSGSGLIGSRVIDSGVYGNGLIGNGGLVSAYDSGLSGGNIYQGGLDSGYQSSGLIGGGGLVGSSLLSGGGGSNLIRTVSAPAVSTTYESSVDTDYGSNGGYVYEKKH